MSNASGQTPNIGLNQWSGEDQFFHGDFNEDNLKIDAALSSVPKIAEGHYSGTGSYGAANKTSLSFDFVPKLLYISVYQHSSTNLGGASSSTDDIHGDTYYHALIPYGALVAEYRRNGSAFSSNYRFETAKGDGTKGACPFALSNEGKTLTWYNVTNDMWQLNDTVDYYYVAIG